jgi:hypothetical protein
MLRLDSGLNWHINNLEKQKISRNINTLPRTLARPKSIENTGFSDLYFSTRKAYRMLIMAACSPTPNREPIFSSARAKQLNAEKRVLLTHFRV